MEKCDFNKFAKITLWDGCSPVNLLHIFRTPFVKGCVRYIDVSPFFISKR